MGNSTTQEPIAKKYVDFESTMKDIIANTMGVDVEIEKDAINTHATIDDTEKDIVDEQRIFFTT